MWRRGTNGIAGKSLNIQHYFQEEQSQTSRKITLKILFVWTVNPKHSKTRVSEIQSNAATALTSQGKAALHCQADLVVFLGHLEIPMSGTGGVNPSFCFCQLGSFLSLYLLSGTAACL